MFLIYIGLITFVGWFVCGIINIGLMTHFEGYQDRHDKKFCIAFGPLLTVLFLLIGLVYFPLKWSCQLGQMLGDFLDRIHKN